MLAINTAFMTANLALKTPKGQIILKDIDAKSKHSENVLKTIDEMCQETQTNVLDVETVAVVVGPGSFTGLRIGTAIAKALGCVNNNLKFVALSSLELMAYTLTKHEKVSGEFVCVINALSDLFFVANFDENGIKIQEERMIDKAEFSAIKLPKYALKDDLQVEGVAEIEIECEDVLNFALKKEIENKFVSLEDLSPMYLRLSQAEDMLAKKAKKD